MAHTLGRLAIRRVTAYPALDLQVPLTAFHIKFSMKAFTRCLFLLIFPTVPLAYNSFG